MQTAAMRSTIGFGSILVMVMGLIYFGSNVPAVLSNGVPATRAIASGWSQAEGKPYLLSGTDADLLAGIIFAGSITEQDKAYLRASLQLLYDRMPAWWQYIRDARPFVLAVDLVQAQHGRAAITQCCNVSGYGSITFGLHFGQLAISEDSAGQTPQARQITFLGVLVHEVTHVRDQRAARFAAKADRKTCVAIETSGLIKQLEFKRDLSEFTTASSLTDRATASWLRDQITSEARDLHSREFWDLYCGGMD